ASRIACSGALLRTSSSSPDSAAIAITPWRLAKPKGRRAGGPACGCSSASAVKTCSFGVDIVPVLCLLLRGLRQGIALFRVRKHGLCLPGQQVHVGAAASFLQVANEAVFLVGEVRGIARRAQDGWLDEHHQVALLLAGRVVTEQLPEDGNAAKQGNALLAFRD